MIIGYALGLSQGPGKRPSHHSIAIRNDKRGGKSLPLMNEVKLVCLEKPGRLLSSDWGDHSGGLKSHLKGPELTVAQGFKTIKKWLSRDRLQPSSMPKKFWTTLTVEPFDWKVLKQAMPPALCEQSPALCEWANYRQEVIASLMLPGMLMAFGFLLRTNFRRKGENNYCIFHCCCWAWVLPARA